MLKNIRKNIHKTIVNARRAITHTKKAGKTASTCVSIATIRQTILSDDGTTFEEVLMDIYTQRRAMSNMKMNIVTGKPPQPLLAHEKIFSLEKHGERYYMKRSTDDHLFCPEGHYIFIIPFNQPYTVLCAILPPEASGESGKLKREGHTSFQKDQDENSVYFAGIIQFKAGRLLSWNNASGHFAPSPEHRYHLLPYVKLLLPETLFREYRPTQ